MERFAQPLLTAESPDRIAFATPASALAYAGTNLHLTVQDDAHLAAGQTFAAVSGRHGALLAQSGDLRVIAANGPVTVQAHTGKLELLGLNLQAQHRMRISRSLRPGLPPGFSTPAFASVGR